MDSLLLVQSCVWAQDEPPVDKSLMAQLLLSSAYTEPRTAQAARAGRSWEGTGPGEHPVPRGCPRAQGVVLNETLGGFGQGVRATAQGLAGHWSVGGEQPPCA